MQTRLVFRRHGPSARERVALKTRRAVAAAALGSWSMRRNLARESGPQLAANARKAGPMPMQMGPALLPTPLSPACGWSRSRCVRRTLPHLRWGHAWRPMSHPSLPGPATGLARVSSPALAPASGLAPARLAFTAWPKPPVPAALRIRVAETASLYRSQDRRKPACAFSTLLPFGQVLGLSGATASLPSLGGATCHRPKPPACRPGTGAWTDVTAAFSFRNP